MSINFTVKALNNSIAGGVPMNSGIIVQIGQLLTVSVASDDTWTGAAGGTSNANGLGNINGQFLYNGFSFQSGSLVGSIDNGKTFFAVGTRLEMSILEGGTLLLYYWNKYSTANSGEVTATVERYRGPM